MRQTIPRHRPPTRRQPGRREDPRFKSELTLANTGPGIEPESLPRIFDRFYRGESAVRGSVEGSGLGLSIAQWIVHAHGGTISLSSTPGQRTTVRIALPLTATSASFTPERIQSRA